MRKQGIGIVMNGVTGRMGYHQHLVRSILAIREQGGVQLSDGSRVVPEPLLVGRNEHKLREVAEHHGLDRWTTSLPAALEDPATTIYFDAQATQARAQGIAAAIAAGKHIYTEKPTATTQDAAVRLVRLARDAGTKNGVVHDKLFLPGIVKLKLLIDTGFFGRILSVRGEFGYWVFEGDLRPSQRPSWNYRKEDDGGIVLDMFCHWSYLLENLFGRVEAVSAKAVTHVPERWDERGQRYKATADDAAYAILEMTDGVVAQLNSSWCVRVHRDELVEFQVDGTEASAVAGLRQCRVQHRATTPAPVWNPDLPVTERFRDQWQAVPEPADLDNGFKRQWEDFIRHVCEDAPFPYDFASGARGVQLAELVLRSSAEGRRIEIPEIHPGGSDPMSQAGVRAAGRPPEGGETE